MFEHIKYDVQQIRTSKFGNLDVYWVLKVTNRGNRPIFATGLSVKCGDGGLRDNQLEKVLTSHPENIAQFRLEPNQTQECYFLRAEILQN